MVFSKLAASQVFDHGRRVLILAHRHELLSQAQSKLESATGIVAGLEGGGKRASHVRDVVVAGVDTVVNRLGDTGWGRNDFQLVIVDEAHHALAKRWRTVIDWFCDQTKGGHARLLGVTATPDRGDKQALSQVFESVAYQVSMRDLIEQGFLCPVMVQHLPIAGQLDDASRRSMGDVGVQVASRTLQPIASELAREIAAHAWDRKLIVFLPLCEDSRRFTEALNGYGLDARHIQGDSEDRDEVLRWFAEPGPRALCNASLLLEGFDQPDVDAVCVLRPTEIRSLYAQAIGRGTRPAPGKDYLLILDPLWLTGKFNLATPASLLADSAEEAAHVYQATMRNAAGPVDLLTSADDGRADFEEKLKRRIKQARKEKPPRGKIDALLWSAQVGEFDLESYEPTMDWERMPSTERQMAKLKQLGFWPKSIRDRGHAARLLQVEKNRRERGLATVKQMEMLRRFKHPEPERLTVREASAFISSQLENCR